MKTAVKEKNEKLLKTLTYEIVDGKPIYYRGYRDVLEGKKHPEEVMGVSILQAKVIQVIVKFLLNNLSEENYEVLFNEIGVYTKRGFRSLDIGIFDKGKISKYISTDAYSKILPLIAIEVDVKSELEDKTYMEYIEEKVEDLFEGGTDKVIWVLTRPRIVIVFERGKEGKILRWDDDIEVIEGVRFKLSDLVQP